MSDAPAPEVVDIQKLLLRVSAAIATNEPVMLLSSETPERVNDVIVAALNLISRSSRLSAVIAAARPLAERLSSEGGDAHQAQLTQLGRAVVTALGRADPRPVTPHYSTFTSTFRGCVQKIFDRAGTDAESFARAVDRSLDGRTASC